MSFSQLKDLQPNDINIHFGPKDKQQEIAVWKEFYGIEKRYKDKLCKKNEGKYWVRQLLDEYQNIKKNPKDFLKMTEDNIRLAPWADANFLKKAFYDECVRAGLLDLPI